MDPDKAIQLHGAAGLSQDFPLAAAFAWIAVFMAGITAAQNGSGRKVPVFDVDTTFPKLPNNWVLGYVSKVVVERKSLEVLYQFGKRSAAPGDFQGVHHLVRGF